MKRATAPGTGSPWPSDAQRDHAADTLRQLRQLGQKLAAKPPPAD